MKKLYYTIACAAMGLLVVSVAIAQSTEKETGSESGIVAPHFEFSTVDENGVDITTGSVRMETQVLSIGAGDSALSYTVTTPSLAHTAQVPNASPTGRYPGRHLFTEDSFSGGVQTTDYNECEAFFEFGGGRTYFCGTQSTGWVAKGGGAETLTLESGDYVFTTKDGVKVYSGIGTSSRTSTSTSAGIKSIRFPSGLKIDVYRSANVISYVRNDGLMVRTTTSDNWKTTTVRGINTAVDYCAPLASSCSFSVNWPTATIFRGNTYGQSPVTAYVENQTGQRTELYTRYNQNGMNGFHYNKIKPAGADVTATITYSFCSKWDVQCGAAICYGVAGASYNCEKARLEEGKVLSAQKNGKTWAYDFTYGYRS